MRDCIGDTSGKKILDLGCGTCSILKSIANQARYVGVDFCPDYIKTAKETFRDRKNVEFYCEDLNTFVSHSSDRFDLVIMSGVMHHITDAEIDSAMGVIKKLLAPGGTFHSLDGVYTDNMNIIARILLDFDRGQYVRRKEEWVALMRRHWRKCDYVVRTDTLEIPYSVIIFSCGI